VYDKPNVKDPLLITLLSPLLFLAPEVHLREVEKLWTDEVIIETVWKSFMTKSIKRMGRSDTLGTYHVTT
jgi:hypothetical protein